MALDIASTVFGLLATIVVMVIFTVPALYISGRLLAGKGKAKFTDALWIVALGSIVYYFFDAFVAVLVEGALLSLFTYLVLLMIWLGLVKHFFDCGWLKSLAISIIALIITIVIWVVIALALAAVGLSAGWIPIPQF
ncbi:MAG: hypothetical protein NWE93_04870 [Candidatus Bathyarchaeota archaeon]|nr:hypothetical protein [Candidatus Bathyarchaeota archaeon]